MAIAKIILPGLHSSIQDNGRTGYGSYGIPSGGVMDRDSYLLNNALLDNEENTSVIECTYTCPTIHFSASASVAITGAIAQPLINEKPIGVENVFHVQKDDVLSFGKMISGCRIYIGVKGGFQTNKILGSQSTSPTANILSPLKKGDQISYSDDIIFVNNIHASMNTSVNRKILEVYEGLDFYMFKQEEIYSLLNQTFTIAPQSNRMAYRVDFSRKIKHSYSILSSGCLPGTVQNTPGGDLIFLMRDAQTIGGYPRIFQLTEKSINQLSQLKAGETFSIKMISLTDK